MSDESLETTQDQSSYVSQTTQAAPPEENTQNAQSANEAQWYWADGVPGEGETPDWFYKDKYSSISEQAKAVRGLRQKLGDRTGAPDNYEIQINDELKEAGIEVNTNDPLFKNFTEWARENQVSEEGVNKIVGMYLNAFKESIPSEEQAHEYLQEQIKEIGGLDTYKALLQWSENTLPEKEAEHFKEWAASASADDMKMFLSLKESMSYQNPQPTSQPTNQYTRDDLKDMLNDPRYLSDTEFSKKVNQAYADFLK